MHYAESHYAESDYAECHYAECHYVECHYAECHGAIFLVCNTKVQRDRAVGELQKVSETKKKFSNVSVNLKNFFRRSQRAFVSPRAFLDLYNTCK